MEDFGNSQGSDYTEDDHNTSMEEAETSSLATEEGNIHSIYPSANDLLEENQSIPCRRPLNVELMEYYNSFNDEIEDLFPMYENDNILNIHPSDQSKPLINKVILERESVSSAMKTFNVCMKQNRLIREQFGLPQLDMEHDFPGAFEFGKYINRVRRCFMNQVGWKNVSIKIDESYVETGFILPLDLALRELLQKFGGENGLKIFTPSHRNGSRCYSSILDSQVMEVDQNIEPGNGKALYFSLYVDGTQVTQNGATEAIVFRVRIDNLPKAKQVWRTVGLLVRNKNGTSNNEISDKKRQVFQRLLYQIIKPICLNPYILENVYVRISSVLADQPQERDLACLLRSNTFRNCSACRNLFGSCVEREYDDQQFPPMESNPAPTEPMDAHQPGTSSNNYASAQIPFLSNASNAFHYADEDSFNNTPRSVKQTVSAQLELAVLKRVFLNDHPTQWPLYQSVINSIHSSDGDITSHMLSLRNFLRHECAREFPPALACLPSFGTPPFRLYRSFPYDTLHVLDLGLTRNLADHVHLKMSDSSYRGQLSKSDLIAIANRRMLNLPSLPRVNRYSPFRMTHNEKQAPFTGTHWRNIVPFLWYSLLGLNQGCKPDEDPVFITALSLDRFSAALRQVNENKYESSCFTEIKIMEIEQFGKECSQLMKNLFDIPETTKIHRTMNHLGEYLRMYGNIIYGDTSSNESLHKGLKESTNATNKKGGSFALQLLQANCLAEYMEEMEDKDKDDYYYKDVIEFGNPYNSKYEQISASLESKNRYKNSFELAGVLLADVSDVLSAVGDDPDKIIEVLLTPKNIVQLRRQYQLIRATNITAYLPVSDKNATPTKQILRNEQKNDGYWNHLNGVKYISSALKPTAERFPHIRFGMIQSILYSRPVGTDSSTDPSSPICVIRRMEEAMPDDGNRRLVKDFCYTRLKYVIDVDDVWLDYIPLENVLQKVMILVDPVWFARFTKNPAATFKRSSENKQFREAARFYWMKNFRLSWRGQPIIRDGKLHIL